MTGPWWPVPRQAELPCSAPVLMPATHRTCHRFQALCERGVPTLQGAVPPLRMRKKQYSLALRCAAGGRPGWLAWDLGSMCVHPHQRAMNVASWHAYWHENVRHWHENVRHWHENIRHWHENIRHWHENIRHWHENLRHWHENIRHWHENLHARRGNILRCYAHPQGVPARGGWNKRCKGDIRAEPQRSTKLGDIRTEPQRSTKLGDIRTEPQRSTNAFFHNKNI
jgi:hypothetical protein